MFVSIIERLKATAPSLASVKFAEDLDVVAKGVQRASTTTFVVPQPEKASPNRLATGHRQLVQVRFLVATILRYHSDITGKMRAEEFDRFKGEIEDALTGWEPTDASDPCSLVGTEPTPMPNGVTIFVGIWETSRYLTDKDTP
ncbi:phage tail terminator protein [Agrobacterium pusense]|uniref:Uncharacterized protein n=1 Tax=Agrobacterium pusense TaxID=648995 RepID=A0AA44EPX3_9HYPH|nr:hypothetical protein [Agrobacterium pusense]NRF12164.1 hypothetical protein [Agrobacterium pusense]NRF22874.1 hypothetical protein [Agrobacterium pusense]